MQPFYSICPYNYFFSELVGEGGGDHTCKTCSDGVTSTVAPPFWKSNCKIQNMKRCIDLLSCSQMKLQNCRLLMQVGLALETVTSLHLQDHHRCPFSLWRKPSIVHHMKAFYNYAEATEIFLSLL